MLQSSQPPLQRRRRRARSDSLSWGMGGPSGAPLPCPDPMLGPPGHEVVEVGPITIQAGGERIEAMLCETRPVAASADT